MWKLVKTIVLILVHLAAISVIAYAFYPIAIWYFNHRPILGVDFFNTATFIKFFKENLHIFRLSYLDFWYAGTHIVSYQILNWFRVYSLIARFLPLYSAVKYTSLVAYFLLVVFVYLGTVRLSRNPFVSAVLSILVLYSSNMYGSLTWGGSLPYFANQLFFPFLLWTLASYLESGSKRWFYFAILILGVAVTGHIGNATAFYLPSTLILILLGKRPIHAGIKVRCKEAVLFIVGMELLVYRYFGQFWLILLNLAQTLLSGLHLFKLPTSETISSHPVYIDPATTYSQQVAAFYRNSFYKVFTDTNQLLLIGLGVSACLFLLVVIISRRKREAVSIVGWALVCLYSVAHVYLNANGVDFLPQGWYRAFWQFPVTSAFLIASLVGTSHTVSASYGRVFKTGLFIVWSMLAVAAATLSFIGGDAQKTLATLETQSSPSSAYPEELNLIKSDAEFERLKLKLLPAWIDPHNKNYRFFTDDAQVIIWWNALFDMPQARGYLDASGNINQHHLLDQAFTGGIVENYKYPEDIARNMALYYIDWYAIKYAEGGHVSQSPNRPPAIYLKDAIAEQTDVETHGVNFLYGTKSGKPEIHEEVVQYLKYYRFADSVTSPIVSISNAPTLACFCDFPAYESLIKILSMHDIHSRKLISLYIPETIDSYTERELNNFDIVLLSNYKYQNRNKTFNLLEQYVKRGGKLIFDTGGEVKESQSTTLPEWFPFSQDERKGLGKEWHLDADTKDAIFKDIDIYGFSPPIFDKNPWNFSYPVSSLRNSPQVLLKQKDMPLLIRLKAGNGILYWSGMNLIYHAQYYTNVVESQLFVNILTSLIPLELHDYQDVKSVYKRSNVIDIESKDAGHGILVKRQMYDHWSAKINGQNAKIIKAGPSFPGFMYIPLQTKGPVAAHIEYIGNYSIYFCWFVSLFTALFLLDLSLFNGAILTKYLRKLLGRFQKQTVAWWEKEDEENG